MTDIDFKCEGTNSYHRDETWSCSVDYFDNDRNLISRTFVKKDDQVICEVIYHIACLPINVPREALEMILERVLTMGVEEEY